MISLISQKKEAVRRDRLFDLIEGLYQDKSQMSVPSNTTSFNNNFMRQLTSNGNLDTNNNNIIWNYSPYSHIINRNGNINNIIHNTLDINNLAFHLANNNSSNKQ